MKNLTLSLLVLLFCSYAAKARPTLRFARTTICVGDTTRVFVTSSVFGGTWSLRTVNVMFTTDGYLLGVTVGSSIMTYTESTGDYATATINVVAATAAITGPNAAFVDSSITLHVSGSFTGLTYAWSSSNPGVASVLGAGLSAGVTGVGVGTATIQYNISPECNVYHTVSVNPTPCTGVPTPGRVSGFTDVCPGITERLVLSGYSLGNTTLQWQSSLDSVAWADVFGARYPILNDTPSISTWYRCKVTCATSGLDGYSGSRYVPKRNAIFSNSHAMLGGMLCNTARFTVNTCNKARGLNIVTIYGDGSADTTIVSRGGYGNTLFDHSYSLPGTYTVKHLLRLGTIPQDSVVFSYEHFSCRTIPIKLYFDANNNCLFDSGDFFNHKPVTIRIDSNFFPIGFVNTTSGFYYQAYGNPGDIYIFRIESMSPGLSVSCPIYRDIRIEIPALGDTIGTNYFGLVCSGVRPLDVELYTDLNCSNNAARGVISVSNDNCTPISTTVTLQVNPKYVFATSSIPPTSVIGGTVIWNLDSISYLSGSKYIYYGLLPPDLLDRTTWPSLRDTLLTVVSLGTIPGDIDTTNNRATQIDTVRGGFDPNDIAVSPTGYILPCTELTYTINFENMGNDTAHNIYVMDTLSDYLDIRSMEIVNATATMNVLYLKYEGHNVVKFDFPNIKLPDSSHHNLCKGSVVYKIKANNGLADEETILNKAAIFFDYNEPVITNTVVNTIGMAPLTGPDTVCLGAYIYLSSLTQGGTWYTIYANAAVDAGKITGMTAGFDVIRYTVANACGPRTVEKTIVVHSVTPSVSIATGLPDGRPVCEGSAVTLTAVSVNSGPAPAYTWSKNGVADGTLPTYSYSPANGDTVVLNLTSNAYCRSVSTVFSPVVALQVEPSYLPWVDIVTDTMSDGDSLRAIVSNGGPSPTYQWVINNRMIPGATTTAFSQQGLANRDSVSCMVTGTGDCSYGTFNSVIIYLNSTGLSTQTQNKALSLLPNPNRGSFVVSGCIGAAIGSGQVVVEVKNIVGQVVYKAVGEAYNGMVQLPVTLGINTVKGIYFLSIFGEGGSKTIRFVVE